MEKRLAQKALPENIIIVCFDAATYLLYCGLLPRKSA
jgi:hypothetical protein